jgi:arylsulfatase A-like enzyme
MKKLIAIVVFFILCVIIVTLYPRILRIYKGCPKCNIVVLSIDPLRADNLPCFGYRYNTAPNICRFANRNIIFTNAYAQSSWTLPSIMSMVTSQYPYEHGMLLPYQSVLAPNTTTLPQALQKAGYHTVYVGDTANSHLPLDKGLGRGFDQITEYKHETGEMLDIIKAQKNINKPMFMFIHNFDMQGSWNNATNPPRTYQFDPTFTPPQIYNPKEFLPVAWNDAIYFLEQKLNLSADYARILSLLKKSKSSQQAYIYFRQLSLADQQAILAFSIFEHIDMKNSSHIRLLRNLYDERLAQVDRSLSPLLDMLTSPPWSEDTIVILLANHGDELGEHGRMSHGTNLFASTTRIPIIMRIPNVISSRIDGLVASIDVFPTILDIVGITIPKTVRGESLLSLISKQTTHTKRDYVVSQLGPLPWLSMIRTPSWSYYQDKSDQPPTQLYNLRADPEEQKNVLNQHADQAKKLDQILQRINMTHNTISPTPSP